MKFEVLRRLRVKTGESKVVILESGLLVDWPEHRARALAKAAPDDIRLITTADAWLIAWRQLANLTTGIPHDDPRFDVVMHALADCDEAFQRDDWNGFEQAVNALRLSLQGTDDLSEGRPNTFTS
jgi:hypothetical protein